MNVAEAKLRLAEAKENARMCMRPPCGNCRTGVELARQALRDAQATPEPPKQAVASEVGRP